MPKISTKRRIKPVIPERYIQNAIIDFINHTPGAFAYEIDNNGRFSRGLGIFRRNDPRYRPPGIPDICAYYKTRHFYIEAKSKIGRLSEAQIKMHAKLLMQGVSVAVCRSVEDVKILFEKFKEEENV